MARSLRRGRGRVARAPRLRESLSVSETGRADRAIAAADDQAFAALASSRSEGSRSLSSGGDLGFIDKNSRLPKAIVEAALSLRTPGDVAGPIRTDAGYEILRLVSRRAGVVSPLSAAQGQIRQRLYQERREKALEGFIANLRTQTPVDLIDGG